MCVEVEEVKQKLWGGKSKDKGFDGTAGRWPVQLNIGSW
jgi:hypothetical protein